MDLNNIAIRIAVEPATEEEEQALTNAPKKEDINWKALPKHQKNLKILVRKLDEAIKDQKNIDLYRVFGEMIDTLGMLAKVTGQRNVMTRLETVEKIFKGD